MRFIEKHIFLIMISTVLTASLLVYFVIDLKKSPKRIEIDHLMLDNEIKYDFDIEQDGSKWTIQGYAFHPDNLIDFENYISGSGRSYKIDTKVILQGEDDVFALYTSPLYRKDAVVNDFDFGRAGFYSEYKVDQLPKEKLRLGFIVEVNNEQHIVWSSEVITNE